MFCTTCGAEFPPGFPFCTRCGAAPESGEAGSKMPDAGGPRQMAFHGRAGALLSLYLVNAALTVLTLGVYWFWGEVRVRQYLYQQSEFDGDRFDFHGTGLEMFTGFLRALVLIAMTLAASLALIYVALNAGGVDPKVLLELGISLAVYPSAAVFVPLSIVGALRYRLSRTSWRGIRFSLQGRPLEFLGLCLGAGALTLATLGLYWPFAYLRMRRYIVSRVQFGTERFRFTGQGRDLFAQFLIMVVLFLPSLGLSRLWWAAEVDRYCWRHTQLGMMRFESSVTAGGLLGLKAGNLVRLIFTLGLAAPWIAVRNLRYRMDHLTMYGALDYAAIAQQVQTASATGEELADAFDINLDLGV